MVTKQPYVIYIYIYIYIFTLAKPWNSIDFLNVICILFFCFGIQLTNQKNNPMVQPIMDLYWIVFSIVFFVLWYVCFFVLVCELDAKAKGQKTDSIAKIVCVFSMFLKFLPNISKTQWKKKQQTNGGPWKVDPCLRHVYTATPHGYHPGVHVLLICSSFGHALCNNSFVGNMTFLA